jgi:D-alanyl-D-alanine carboxypeptidase (penicillin-binding protein 5/6)
MRHLVPAIAAVALLAAPSALAGPPPVAARAYLVENGATGEVLAARAPAERLPMASITKLMTVLVTLEHEPISHVVTVAPGAAAVGESSIDLRAGERLTVRDLLEAALIQSANDAADALAYDVGHGDEGAFVAMMNARARRLGLRDTHFTRPDGLDAPGHYSSARDLTLLARVVMHQPVVRQIVRERTATIPGRVLHTWNDLLGTFPGLYGVKTGHTAAAGWCEVGAVRGRGFSIYATVLGSPTRAQRNADLAALLRYGLSRYRTVTLVQPGRAYAHVGVGYGRTPLALVPERQLVRAVRVDRPLTQRVVAETEVRLPVRKGQVLGEVRVFEGRKLLGVRPLLASRAVAPPGVVGRIRWYAGRTVHHFVGFFS